MAGRLRGASALLSPTPLPLTAPQQHSNTRSRSTDYPASGGPQCIRHRALPVRGRGGDSAGSGRQEARAAWQGEWSGALPGHVDSHLAARLSPPPGQPSSGPPFGARRCGVRGERATAAPLRCSRAVQRLPGEAMPLPACTHQLTDSLLDRLTEWHV